MSNDANPEAILVSDPLDGSSNSRIIVLGARLLESIGVFMYDRDSSQIRPTTAVRSDSLSTPALPPATSLKFSRTCSGIFAADYDIETFFSGSPNAEGRSNHIVNYLGTPDLVFLQEVQDDNAPKNDNVVNATETLDTLVGAISRLTAVKFEYVDIDPVDDQDGEQPGGNFRTTCLYNPSVLRLPFITPGSSTNTVRVLAGLKPSLNPGRIDPSSCAWSNSRKPLAA